MGFTPQPPPAPRSRKPDWTPPGQEAPEDVSGALEQIRRREYEVVIAYGGGGAGGSCFAGGGGGGGGLYVAGGGGLYVAGGGTASGLVECQYCARFGRLGSTCQGCGAAVAPLRRRSG